MYLSGREVGAYLWITSNLGGDTIFFSFNCQQLLAPPSLSTLLLRKPYKSLMHSSSTKALRILEIFELVALSLEDRRDLLSLTLLVPSLCHKVFARRLDRRVETDQTNVRAWDYFMKYPDRAEMVRTLLLELIEKASEALEEPHKNNALAEAVNGMKRLERLKVWEKADQRNAAGSIGRHLSEAIPKIHGLGSLRNLEVDLQKLNGDDFCLLSNLTGLVDLNMTSQSVHHGAGSDLAKFLCGNLNLVRLRLDLTAPRAFALSFPLELGEFFRSVTLCCLLELSISIEMTSGSVRDLALFLERHPKIISLSLETGIRTLPNLAKGSLPDLRELTCSESGISSIFHYPMEPSRPLTKIGGFGCTPIIRELFGSAFIDSEKIGEITYVSWGCLSDLWCLVGIFPNITTLVFNPAMSALATRKDRCIGTLRYFQHLRRFRGIALFENPNEDDAEYINKSRLSDLARIVPPMQEIDIWHTSENEKLKRLIVLSRDGDIVTASIAHERATGPPYIEQCFLQRCHDPNKKKDEEEGDDSEGEE
ncbi:hypothetical protein BD410DRAFT_121658 [Rickenella mellea]|uniref:Uncharacterized protein n=1 Tax=Rickenella mellea TaxID=50990 RepID=A0A4Y7PJW2_9AGAM|nr:hypothetical protein BD410DRAFT_121658 [Rickenella mellea]